MLRKGSRSTRLWESPRVPSERYEPRPCLCVFVARFDRRIFFTIRQKRIHGGSTYAECNSGSLKEHMLLGDPAIVSLPRLDRRYTMGLLSSTRQPHTRCALSSQQQAGRGEGGRGREWSGVEWSGVEWSGLEWSGGEGKGGEGNGGEGRGGEGKGGRGRGGEGSGGEGGRGGRGGRGGEGREGGVGGEGGEGREGRGGEGRGGEGKEIGGEGKEIGGEGNDIGGEWKGGEGMEWEGRGGGGWEGRDGMGGGKLHGRYPDEGTGQYTVYSQTIPQRGPCP